MGFCVFCLKIEELPFTCKFCGGDYCKDHHLPENHNCLGLEKWKKDRQKRGIYDPIYEPFKDSPATGIQIEYPETHAVKKLGVKCYLCNKKFKQKKPGQYCVYCKETFCASHSSPSDHNCPNYQSAPKKSIAPEPLPPIKPEIGTANKKKQHIKRKLYKTSVTVLKISILVFLSVGFIQPSILNQNAPNSIKPYVLRTTDYLVKTKTTFIGFIERLSATQSSKGEPTIHPKSTSGWKWAYPPPATTITSTLAITTIPPITAPPPPSDVKTFLWQFPDPDYNNPYLRELVKNIVRECPSDDKACKLYRIYKYIIINYEYRYDPSKLHFQSPPETLEKGYGVCIDFAILFYNYLMATDITTYVVDCPQDEHAYAIACGIGIEPLKKYVDQDLRKLSGRYVIPDLEFEVNKAFDESCLHLEGPSDNKDEVSILFDYPGRYIDAYIDPETGLESPITGKRYAINPDTKEWDEIENSEIFIIQKKPF